MRRQNHQVSGDSVLGKQTVTVTIPEGRAMEGFGFTLQPDSYLVTRVDPQLAEQLQVGDVLVSVNNMIIAERIAELLNAGPAWQELTLLFLSKAARKPTPKQASTMQQEAATTRDSNSEENFVAPASTLASAVGFDDTPEPPPQQYWPSAGSQCMMTTKALSVSPIVTRSCPDTTLWPRTASGPPFLGKGGWGNTNDADTPPSNESATPWATPRSFKSRLVQEDDFDHAVALKHFRNARDGLSWAKRRSATTHPSPRSTGTARREWMCSISCSTDLSA